MISGIFWYFWYLTFGYFTNYKKHKLLLLKSSEVWNTK